ncbi:hypothetical protein FKM82_013244 [Ascaphus truei]
MCTIIAASNGVSLNGNMCILALMQILYTLDFHLPSFSIYSAVEPSSATAVASPILMNVSQIPWGQYSLPLCTF